MVFMKVIGGLGLRRGRNRRDVWVLGRLGVWVFGCLVAWLFGCLVARGQAGVSSGLLSFEDVGELALVDGSAGSRVFRSDAHVKHGDWSLCWVFDGGGRMSIRGDVGFECADASGGDTYLSAFIVWIYSERAVDERVRFEFLKGGRCCCWFDFNVNFRGWRGAWVCFERDMVGVPEEGMDEIRVVAPGVGGRLWIDHVMRSVKVDSRWQSADRQVPFVNVGSDNHWLGVYRNSLLVPDIGAVALTDGVRDEIGRIEARFRELVFHRVSVGPVVMEELRERYGRYGIVRGAGCEVRGMPIFFVRAAEAYERLLADWDKDMFVKAGNEMGAYFELMERIASCYCSTDDDGYRRELEEMFLSMYDHITDQGVVDGSCWGNVHHYGYSLRCMYVAYYLMRDVLRRWGRLDEATRTLLWYGQANELYRRPERNGIDMDTFNTAALGCVAGILIGEDGPEKVQRLLSLQRWLDWGCRPAEGLLDAFKADGSAYHHCNHYPAYAVGGLGGATEMIYLLSGTRFAVGSEAFETVKRVLLTMRFYCNGERFPLSMSGRHPDGRGRLQPVHYAYMALAGGDGVDVELGRAFLRLTSGRGGFERRAAELLRGRGLDAERDPEGNVSMPWACSSVHRRGGWLAVVRGHSRYLWAAEHYLGANRYGRYLSHGSMEIGYGGGEGWRQEGFDWNRIPGTTTVHLPIDSLEADVRNVDSFSGWEEMLLSDEAFAGGLSHGGRDGCFGMVLHGHDKYDGTLRARKSFHFLGDFIVCMGSDIEDGDEAWHTETTVFQERLGVAAGPQQTGRLGEWTAKRWLIDPAGTGYYLGGSTGDRCRLVSGRQVSRYQDSGEENEGCWMSLVVDHGRKPHGEGYEYAVVPGATEAGMERFAAVPGYRVLQRDRRGHIVRTADGVTTSYVLFERPDSVLPEGLVATVDTCCLLMATRDGDGWLLTVAQPDLALYRGASDDVYDASGRRVERSIYSREWTGHGSGVIPVTVTLRGEWSLGVAAEPQQTERLGDWSFGGLGCTRITVLCRAGESVDLRLKKGGLGCIGYADAQYDYLVKSAEERGKDLIPKTVAGDGRLVFIPIDDWCSGFYAGCMWKLSGLSRKAEWQERARHYTELLDSVKRLTWHHDVGFMIGCSYLNGYRMTGESAYREVIIESARSLSTRFREGAGVIQSWNVDRGWQSERGWTCPVIIDNMMNLELLFEATRLSGDSTYHRIAVSHAEATMKNHFRPDGSCYHVVDYDPGTGEVLHRHTAQGYAHESGWARGQAWAIYGYTVCYRYTHDERYLRQAERTAHYVLNAPTLPADHVPYWDFDAPDIPLAPRDASSAACMASAFLEMERYLPGKGYGEEAARMMESLSSDRYRARVGENGGFLLMHSVGSIPHGSEIDVPLNYADYYYLEALERMKMNGK